MNKLFFLITFHLICTVCIAQIERPVFASLESFAPKNPEQANAYLPKKLKNTNVASILVMNSSGLATQRTLYNKDGWPTQLENSALIATYQYSPDYKKITANIGPSEKHVYEINNDGNVKEFRIEDNYGNVQQKTENSYDGNGNLIGVKRYKKSKYAKDKYALQPIGEYSYTYDAQNRATSEIGENSTYNYSYKVEGNHLMITTTRSGENVSKSTYNKEGVLTKFEYFLYGTKTTDYEVKYNSQGLLSTEKITSTIPSDNKTIGYVISFRDGTIQSPDNNKLAFVDSKKTNNVYTKATSNFSIHEGFFDKGQLNGPGMLTQNGLQLKGHFKDGMLDGFGLSALLIGNQLYTFGMYEKGKLNGYGFVVEGMNVIEAGIYKDGKLIQSTADDLLNKKTQVNCQGNCTDGFGLKRDNEQITFANFKNGEIIGPYIIMQGNQFVQSGAITEQEQFFEGMMDEYYYYGIWRSKSNKAKMVRKNNSGMEYGVVKNDVFEPKFEGILQ